LIAGFDGVILQVVGAVLLQVLYEVPVVHHHAARAERRKNGLENKRKDFYGF
jgi:hypothetical protein